MKEHEKELLSRCAAYELANNFDYVPNFEEEETDDFFQEFVSEYGEDVVKSACEREGCRSDEVTNSLINYVKGIFKK